MESLDAHEDAGRIEMRALDSSVFFDEFIERADALKHGEKISIITMALEPGEDHTQRVVASLAKSALRGVTVTMAIDAFAVMEPRSVGTIFTPWLRTERYARRRDALRELVAAGVRVGFVNTGLPGITSVIAGRSHIKGYALGDTFYTSGANLERTNWSDVSVRIESPAHAEIVHTITSAAAATGSIKQAVAGYETFPIDDDTELLLDAGKPGKSIIFRQATELIQSAEEQILLTSQYLPTAPLMRHLAAARQRGVEVQVFYAHPSHHGKLAGIMRLHQSVMRKRFPDLDTYCHEQPRSAKPLHSKVLASEQSAITGSHNFDAVGVRLGTAELSIRTQNKSLMQELRQVVANQIAIET